MALDPAFFMDIDAFKQRMDDYVDLLHNCDKAENYPRIYVHGEKEFDIHEQRERDGIPIDAKTVESLIDFADEFGEDIEFIE
jgi:LDH2 family malate/lactate/ureidoglycolate dehydrogenase